MNTQKIYNKITDTIIEMLEKHKQSNFSESWIHLSGSSIFAKNAVSKHIYSGINQLILNYLRKKYEYDFNAWMTFKQLSKLGGKIKKGSKAAMVVYNSALYFDKDTDKNITKLVEYLIKNNKSLEHLNFRKVGYLKGYNVFNIGQIENLPQEFYKIEELEKLSEFEQNEQAEHIINSSKANIVYLAQNRAYYSHVEDKIYLPERKQFVSDEAFYNVAFHEIGHWTGNAKRLDRPKGSVFGSRAYAFEELVAEINSAFLCAYIGFESRITDNVDYIDNWLSVMNDDKQFIVQASSKAQKSADYILEFAKVEELETA